MLVSVLVNVSIRDARRRFRRTGGARHHHAGANALNRSENAVAHLFGVFGDPLHGGGQAMH